MSYLEKEKKLNGKYKKMQDNLKNKFNADDNLFNYHLLGGNKAKFKNYLEVNISDYPFLNLPKIKQKCGITCLCNTKIVYDFYIINKTILKHQDIIKTKKINDYVFIVGKDCIFKFIDIRKDSNGRILYLRCSCGNWHNNKNKMCDVCTIINENKIIVRPLLNNILNKQIKKLNQFKKDLIFAKKIISMFKNNLIKIKFGKYNNYSLKYLFINNYDYIKYIYNLKYSEKTHKTIEYKNKQYLLNKAYDIKMMVLDLNNTLDFLYKNKIIESNKFSQLI